jgi:hypothetical protein
MTSFNKMFITNRSASGGQQTQLKRTNLNAQIQ